MVFLLGFIVGAPIGFVLCWLMFVWKPWDEAPKQSMPTQPPQKRDFRNPPKTTGRA